MFSAPYYQLILRVATGGQLCRSHVRAGGLSGWTAVAQDVVRARAGTWDGTKLVRRRVSKRGACDEEKPCGE